MKYVYFIRTSDGQHHYVGLTDDLKERLARYNNGEVPHTSKYGPWHLKTYIAFSDPKSAATFEKYLKASGRAFSKMRL